VVGWREELLVLVRDWERSVGSETRSPRRLGIAHRVDEAGWYSVDLRGDGRAAPSPESLDDLRLVPGDAPAAARGHRVLDIEPSGDVLRVRISAHVDDATLELRGSGLSPARLVTALRSVLESLVKPGLADELVRGQPARSVLPTVHLPGLNPEQCQAYAACHSPGLHLVWGPPGTGKTRVLAMAIGDMLDAGRRVLLVSSTNVAVDNALLGTLRIRRPGPGVAVRVGPPQIPEVARDEEVNLPRLVSRRAAQLTERRERLEHDLVELTAPARELTLVEQRLQGFDKDGYRHATVLVQNEERRETAAHSLAVAQGVAHRVAAEHAQAQDELRAREQQRADLQPAADLLAKAAQLQAKLDAVWADHQQIARAWQAAVSALRSCDEQAAEVGPAPWWRRLGTRSSVRDHQQRRAQLERNADKAKSELDCSKDVTRKEDAELTPQVQQLREQAAPVDEQALETADRECENASTRHSQTRDRLAEADAAVQRATIELKEAEGLPRLDNGHRRLLADARIRDVPTLLARHDELRSLLAASGKRIRDLEQQQEKVLGDLDRFRRDAETEIIRDARLVATTLARARAHPAVLRDGFDVVLIDEVGAALVPEILPTVAQAGRTAVLLGDFCQLGSIPPQLDEKRPDVQKWFYRDAFEFCGITSPKLAQEHPGCVVLSQQYRFPPAITVLANEVGYGGVLRDGAERVESNEDPRIVLIDTDGLDDLAFVRRTKKIAGWWPAGALLTRVIAQYHRDQGESVGVITPYRSQAEATLEAIRDVEGNDDLPEIAVGTAHRVQGREFDVAVVDLVEDGRQSGWLANASLSAQNDWYREGARLFTVATTRPRQRLYLIGSGDAVRSARKGTVLATVAAMVTNGRIHELPATALLPGSDNAPLHSPALAELAITLAQWVRVVELHDETTFFAAFTDELDRADESIWLWAPWTGARMRTLLDTLALAVQRGVRVVTFVRGVKDQIQGRPVFQGNAAALRAIGVHVIEYQDMHQKIVVIDRRTTMIGSLNALSHNRTREVMVVHDGRMFAERLLQHEYAAELSKVPLCAQCGSTPEVRRYKRVPPLWWYCTACRWSEAVKLSKGTN
jgi:AAA domain/PLD-like domain